MIAESDHLFCTFVLRDTKRKIQACYFREYVVFSQVYILAPSISISAIKSSVIIFVMVYVVSCEIIRAFS